MAYGILDNISQNPTSGSATPKKQQGEPDWGATWGTGNDQAVAEGNAAYNAGQRGSDPNKVAGYGDRAAWDKWYASQQGGNRPEDMARFSDQTLAGWDQWLQKSGPNAGKYRSMRGAEGWYDKPTECPPGMMPSGPSETDPCIPNGSGGAGGGGGYGGGGGQGGPGGPGGYGQGEDLALYTVKRQYADALADPTGQKAWQLFTGQGGEKTFTDSLDATRAQIAGMPQGPERAYAEQKLREQEQNLKLQLPQMARTSALQGLTGVIQPELGYVGAERDRSLQDYIAKVNAKLGFGNLALGQGQLGLQSQQQWFNQNRMFPWEVSQGSAQLANQRYGIDAPAEAQRQAAQASGYGQAINSAVGLAGQYLQNRNANRDSYAMSDVRVKENIAPGRRGLSDLLKLRSYTYKYKGAPRVTQSVMAQDLEKVAPEFVAETDEGLKMVDTYGLLGMTMQAVKDLAEKVEKN